jgi:hypothetical protein
LVNPRVADAHSAARASPAAVAKLFLLRGRATAEVVGAPSEAEDPGRVSASAVRDGDADAEVEALVDPLFERIAVGRASAKEDDEDGDDEGISTACGPARLPTPMLPALKGGDKRGEYKMGPDGSNDDSGARGVLPLPLRPVPPAGALPSRPRCWWNGEKGRRCRGTVAFNACDGNGAGGRGWNPPPPPDWGEGSVCAKLASCSLASEATALSLMPLKGSKCANTAPALDDCGAPSGDPNGDPIAEPASQYT